jgi:SHAQKYF class myb-like DNA-binding protein
MKVDKATKQGSGRWTQKEHELFLQGLEKYGKNWGAIQRLVGTRTKEQAKSHAQKHFLKADKGQKETSLLTGSALKILMPEAKAARRDVGMQYGEGVMFCPRTDMLALLACVPFVFETRYPS